MPGHTPATESPEEITLVVEREISGVILGARLRSPSGVVSDRSGRLYVADKGNHRLILFDSQFTAIKQVGGFGSANGQLQDPGCLTLDNDLSLLVVDPGNRRVCRFSSALEYVSRISHEDPADPLLPGLPIGVAVNRRGEVWTSSESGRCVTRFDLGGTFVQSFRGIDLGGSEFVGPGKLISRSDGAFYLCDPERPALYVIDPEQERVTDVIRSKLFTRPVAAIQEKERLWIVDEAASKLLLFTDRTLKAEFGPHLPGIAIHLAQPNDIALLGTDRLVISDAGNDRILVIRMYREKIRGD